MLKKSLVLLAACGLITHAACAQDTAAADPVGPAKSTTTESRVKAVTVTTPAPAATPEPRKKGFFKRVFGKQDPVVIPAPTPAPKATPRPFRRPHAPPTPSPDENVTEEPKKSEPAKTEPTTKPAPVPSDATEIKPPAPDKPAVEVPPAPAATPAPIKKGGKKPVVAPVKKTASTPPDTKDPDVLEKWKYDEAKARALEDADVADLKGKADAALNEDEGRKALRAYNRALFSKMRRVDPSIKERIDRIETSVMKRLGGAE